MKKYESVVILYSNLKDEERESVINKIKDKINSFGNVTNIEDLGKKRLAYEIKKQKDGYYICFEFSIDEKYENAIAEIERLFRIQDEVMKFIVVRKD